MDCFNQIFSGSLQAQIVVKKIIHTTAHSDSATVRVERCICAGILLAQYQLIYLSHILWVREKCAVA